MSYCPPPRATVLSANALTFLDAIAWPAGAQACRKKTVWHPSCEVSRPFMKHQDHRSGRATAADARRRRDFAPGGGGR